MGYICIGHDKVHQGIKRGYRYWRRDKFFADDLFIYYPAGHLLNILRDVSVQIDFES